MEAIDFHNFAQLYGWSWEDYDSTPAAVLARLRKYHQYLKALAPKPKR